MVDDTERGKSECLLYSIAGYLDGDLEDEMPPWLESHVAVPGVEEVLEQLEELLLPRDVRRQHHRSDEVRKLRELGVSQVPGKES